MTSSEPDGLKKQKARERMKVKEDEKKRKKKEWENRMCEKEGVTPALHDSKLLIPRRKKIAVNMNDEVKMTR